MFRMLLVTALVGTAWTTSHYLTTTSNDFGPEERPLETAVPDLASGTRSVALLDFAVAALPQQQTAKPEPADALEPYTDTTALAPAEAETLPASEAVDPESEARLARQLQRELRRVGCLKSRADGVWGPSSQRAMQRFAERIQAKLPTDRPDGVLLMLVEKYDDRACGAPCAADEQPDARGRCQPREEIAAIQVKPAVTASLAESVSDAGAAPEASASVTTAALLPHTSTKTKLIKTRIGQVTRSKASRMARLKSRKTIWSAPAYGLGMSQTKAPAAMKRKRKRVGASAAYRRWMVRSGVTMR